MKFTNALPKTEETSLIRSAAQGDLDSFNELVLAYQDLIHHHVFALLGDSDSAQDVTQESFIKAFQHIRNFHGESFRAWLLRIATNTAYDIMRRNLRRPLIPLFPEDEDGEENDSSAWLADPTASVQRIVEERELSNEIQRMLDELPAAFRSVLTLVDAYEFNYAEAANALGVPMGTVKSRLARARLQMQEKFRGKLDHPLKYEYRDVHASMQGARP